MKSGKHNPLTKQTNEKSLDAVKSDIFETLRDLDKALYIAANKDGQSGRNLPVAFASNALYVMERNGFRNEEYQ